MSSSFREAEEILEEKEILEEIISIKKELNEIRTNLDSNSEDVFEEYNWETKKQKQLAKYNKPQFDAFKNGVVVEVEQKEQMNLRSHLLFMETAFCERFAECGVLFIRNQEKGVKFSRTVNELGEKGNLFAYHFPLYIPLYISKI